MTQHFDKSSAVWPIEGDVLLDYSMDSTIYFPTLEQYRCNPAMVISGNVNDKVFAMATGKITDIQENEETGCTVIQDLGDGYAAVYGQLKELNFAKGIRRKLVRCWDMSVSRQNIIQQKAAMYIFS